MSASAIADGIITIFTAASPFGAQHVTKNNYALMETSACAIVVQSIRNQTAPYAYGRNGQWKDSRTFFLDCWLKETGNPQSDLNNLLTFQDDVEYVLRNNDTLNDTARGISEIRMERDPEAVWVYGGQQWFRLFCEVDCWELA